MPLPIFDDNFHPFTPYGIVTASFDYVNGLECLVCAVDGTSVISSIPATLDFAGSKSSFIKVDLTLFFITFPNLNVVRFDNYIDGDLGAVQIYPFALPLGAFNFFNFVFRDSASFYAYLGISCDPVPAAITVPQITSLNGINCLHKDSTIVNVHGRLGDYAVDWSTMGMVADSSFTPIYKVSNVDGHNLICPEALLSLPLVP